MDQRRSKRPGLNLNEHQKQTVRALKSQMSSHSASGPTTEGSDHIVTKLSEEELRLLQDVVDTLKNYKGDSEPIIDAVDGKRLQRN